MNGANADLIALQRSLGDLVDKLVRQQEASNDPDAIEAIGAQIREAAFRATAVQRKLFAAQTAAIAAAVEEVERGKAEVEEAIERIEQLNEAIAAVTKFLSLVDKVLALVP